MTVEVAAAGLDANVVLVTRDCYIRGKEGRKEGVACDGNCYGGSDTGD